MSKPIQNTYLLTLRSMLPNGEVIFKLSILTTVLFTPFYNKSDHDMSHSTIKGLRDRGLRGVRDRGDIRV